MPEVRMSDQDLCDFCSSPEPRWLFRCRNYEMRDLVPNPGLLPPQRSVGGWLACNKCAVFVQRADWNGLARRVTANGGINPTVRDGLTLRACSSFFGTGLRSCPIKSDN